MHVIVKNKNSMIGCISETGSSGKLIGTIANQSSAMLPGPPGYTPQRGVDYWTPEDQRYIIDEVLSSGVVISRQAVTLLLTILREANYATDQSENIQKLQDELEKGFEDEPEIPDVPDEPVIPVIQKLTAPEIYLEIDGEPVIPDEPDVSERNTPAILGIAVLGKTTLGNYESGLPKLDAPVIRLTNAQKLDAPVVSLETVDDSVFKLSAPVIRLESDVSDEPEPEPEPEEPDIPVTPKLKAPVIYLETVNEPEPEDPDEPDEPEVPVTPKLEVPVIYLDGCDHANYTSAITTDATCTTDGERTFTCTDCGFVWKESIPATGMHEYASVTTDPTCTEQGYTTHTCTCGDSYTDSYVDALGHDWSNPYYASVFATGYGRKCSRCGALEVMDVPMVKLGTPVIRLMDTKLKTPVIDIHDYSSVVVEPTCTTQGYTLNSCACGDRYADNFVDALGHDWGEPYKLGDEYVRDCARCGERETGAEQYLKGRISIEAVASGDTEFLSDASLFQYVTHPNGRKSNVSLTARYPNISLIEIPLGQYTIAARAGYGWIDGYELTVKYTVQYGDAEPVETNTIVLTPEERNPVVKVIYHYEKIDGEHTHYSYSEKVTEPTCTTRGYTTHTCMCGYSYVDNYVNALGHDWSEPGDDDDEYVRVCERCGERPYAAGNLNVSVVVDGDRTIEDQSEYRIRITRPDERDMTAVLNSAVPETRLISLALGTYKVEALPEYSSVDGYNLTVKYSVDYVVSDPIESQTATLTSEVPTVNVTITYHYEKIPME